MWNIIFKIGLAFIGAYMKRKARDEKMTESYFNFLKQVDHAGLANVANYMAAESGLKAKQKEIRERLENGDTESQ